MTTMNADRIIVLIATSACFIVLLTACCVIPKLHSEINEIHDYVFISIQEFRVCFGMHHGEKTI